MIVKQFTVTFSLRNYPKRGLMKPYVKNRISDSLLALAREAIDFSLIFRFRTLHL